MDFRDATDRLTDCPSHADIANTAGVSLQTVRQARLAPGNANYRSPPARWREAVIQLAEERIARLRELVEELR